MRRRSTKRYQNPDPSGREVYSRDVGDRSIELHLREDGNYELVWDTEMDAAGFADFMTDQTEVSEATVEHFDYSEGDFYSGEFPLEDIRDERFLEFESGDGTREFQVQEVIGVTLREDEEEGVTLRRTDIHDHEIAAATGGWPPEYSRDLMSEDPTTDYRFREAYNRLVGSADI